MAVKPEEERLISGNPAAHSNYAFEELLEAGLVLTGTEIKSLRGGSPNIRDAYVEVTQRGGLREAWLTNAHIGPYSHGNIWNHEALRRRKLLLHRNQIERMYVATTQKGLSIIPTRLYFKKGLAKIELGIGKGRKKYDKRETLKRKSAERDMDIAIKNSKRRE